MVSWLEPKHQALQVQPCAAVMYITDDAQMYTDKHTHIHKRQDKTILKQQKLSLHEN